MARTALVGLGGMAGSVARYWMAGLVQRLAGADFPLGTLGVNVLGSFLVSVFMVLSLERELIGADTRLLLTVGFCGGFTTMSTFSYETAVLLRDGQGGLAAVNVLGTLAACLAAVWLGDVLGRLV